MTITLASVIQVIFNNATFAAALILSTMGITLTRKTANVTNFAQAIIGTVGAYVAAFFFMRLGWSVWMAMPAAIAVSFLLGALIDVIFMRRATRVGGVSRVMITIGLIMLITAFIPMVFGILPFRWARFFAGRIEWQMFGANFSITANALFAFALAVGVVVLIFIVLRATKWGLGVRSTAANMEVASLLGVNTVSIMTVSWGISS
ncbi:MAG: branched-chain amino acid ABC transporter permease, partial [Oscillospiraceae bacterium]|nr:branched-chain amino acid ABC transporter permease [Oscillospiraceae bacterium]